MTKHKIISMSLLFFCLSVFFVFDSSKPLASNHAGNISKPTPTPILNAPAFVQSLQLSKKKLFVSCPTGTKAISNVCSDEMSITLETQGVDPENDVLTYHYTVSSGRIVGTGAIVNWDLRGVQTGSYTVTVGVDDGFGMRGKMITQTVEVEKCDCLPNCTSFSLTVDGPKAPTHMGNPITFTANFSGGTDVSYNWSVSSGTITSGQGTPSITVETTPQLQGRSVTATVELGGSSHCKKTTALTTVEIAALPMPVNILSFASDDNTYQRQGLDRLIFNFQNDPEASATIVTYRKENESALVAERRLLRYQAYLVQRKVDLSKIKLISSTAVTDKARTALYLVPIGANFPDVGETPLTTITGIVMTTAGEVLRGIPVKAEKVGQPAVKFETTTGADGTYYMRPVEPGKYRVVATKGQQSKTKTSKNITAQLTEVVSFEF